MDIYSHTSYCYIGIDIYYRNRLYCEGVLVYTISMFLGNNDVDIMLKSFKFLQIIFFE